MALPVFVAPFCQLIWVFVVAFINLLLLLLGKKEELAPVTAINFPEWAVKVSPWKCKRYRSVRGKQQKCCLSQRPKAKLLQCRALGGDEPAAPCWWLARGCSASLWPGLPEAIRYPRRACAPHVMTSGRVCAVGEEVTWLSFPPFWGSGKSLCADDFGDGNRSWPHLMGELLGSSSPPWQIHVN